MAKSSGDLKAGWRRLVALGSFKAKKNLGSFDIKNRPMSGNSASGIREILRNPESLTLESIIQLKESRIPPTIIWNPESKFH